jgi:hypothetical protein
LKPGNFQKNQETAMSVAELMPVLHTLPRTDKLKVIQLLVTDLTREEGLELQAGAAYPIWTPFEAYDAANVLMQLLEKEQVA